MLSEIGSTSSNMLGSLANSTYDHGATLKAQAVVADGVVTFRSRIPIRSLNAPSPLRQRLARWVTDFFNFSTPC